MKRKLAVLLSLGGLLLVISLVRLLAGQTILKLVPAATAPNPGTNLTFKLQLQSGTSTSVVYVIQTSTNLSNWQPLLSGKTKPGATIQVGGVNPTNKARFFRVQEFGPGLIDTNPPSWTNGVGGQVAGSSPSAIVVGWNAATDDVGVAAYLIYVNGVLVTNVLGDVFTCQLALNLHQPADIRIEAQDASGNSSGILPLVYLPGDRIVAASDDCGRIYVAYIQTNGAFSPVRQIASLNGGSRGLALADFDRDGVLDLIGGGASGNTMTPYFFKGKGDGTFLPPVPLPFAQGANSYMMSATVGDFDGDGNLDFVVNGNERYVFFYWGNGDGTFTVDVKDWGCCGRGLVAGDFNEDGREDLARATAGDGRVRLFLSNGDRTFTETNQVGQFGGDPYGLVTADFNEDGHLDIMENNSSSGDVVFYQGHGDGTFTSTSTNGPVGTIDLNDYAAYGSGDYNGDGHRDVVLATYSGHSVWYFPGNGDGTFSTNSVQLSSGLCNALGMSGTPLPPRVDVAITPMNPVTNLNGTLGFSAVGAGVTSNDFFRWTFGDTGTNPLAWTFGPGTNNMGQSVSHAYTKEGRFVTRLWHTTTNGINSVRGTWVTILGNPPVANPGGPYVYGSQVATQGVWYATVDGSASTDDFGIVSYAWNFGDGAKATNSVPTALHGWPTSGVYTVTLTVTDAARQTDTKSTTITFTNGTPPTAVITGPAVVDETSARNGTWTATFNGASSTSPVGVWQYFWRNNYNGQTGNGSSFQTSWNVAGTNTVSLLVTGNDSQTNATTFTVWVKANALPVPVIQGPRLLTVNQATNGLWYGAWNATNSTDDTGIYVYSWNFGDGVTASGALAAHAYAAQGVYPLVLTVTDNGNQSVSATQSVVVVAGNPPVARITASTLNPEGFQPINFSAASSTSDNGIYQYIWFLPPRTFDFFGQYLDPNQWISANAVQNNRMNLSGQNNWGVTYFFSAGTLLQRGCTIQGTVDTPSTDSQYAMVGLKNLNVSSGQYGQYPYAIYFVNGAVQIYQYGNNAGQPTNYIKGTAYDFRIETKPGAGARYYLRPSGTGAAFTQIFETTSYNDTSFSFGADCYYGAFGFENFQVSGVMANTRDFTAPVFPGGTVTLQVVDAALLTNSTSVVISPLTGTPPSALISGPTNGQAGIQLAFSAYGSGDDHAIASYTWNFGDGSPAVFGPAVNHSYNTVGTYTNTVTIADYAEQTATASLVVTISGSNALLHVPWLIINGLEQPHEIYYGKTNTLKAVARGVPVPFMYVWDYGDGSGTITNWVSNSATIYNLEAPHAYIGGDGTPYYAGITVTLTNGTVFRDIYPLLMRAKSIDIEEKVAIDEGLWHLQKIQTLYDIDANTRGGYWSSSGTICASASAVQAFAVNGHLMTDDPTRDPYVETVQRGINYLLTTLNTIAIGPQTYGNPDGNNNGISLQANSGQPIYETGPVMDAFVAAARPELVAAAGGANVKGRMFRDIVQDLVDMFAWGQYDDPTYGGGWRYGWNQFPDNSASQWGAIGMFAAENFWGIPVPQWVKDRNLVWVAYSAGSSGYGYTGPGDGIATTPSALVQLAFDGITTTNSLWTHGENYLANNWVAGQNFMSQNNLYANYAIAKAMRTANPNPVHNFALTGKDWFLDPANGLARITIDHQFSDGSWTSAAWVDGPLASAWSVLILSSSLFQQGPVAVITVKPNPSAIGYPVVFDGSLSYHKHPGYKITDWRWIFNAANGLDFEHPDAVGPIVTNVYGALSTNTVALRVGDNSTPQLFDIATVIQQTTTPPYPPTADAGGPYVACAGQSVHLDGSGSFCVDAAAGNFIQSYDWEVYYQVPVTFNQGVSGVHAVVTNGYPLAGAYQIGLRVKNANSLVYTNFVLPDQTSDAFTLVYVYDRVIPDLRVRPKATKAQLTWTKAGDYDVVMRSTAGPDRGFAEVGRTASTYATFLDSTIDYGTEYYYRVYAYVNGQPNPIGVSDPVFMVSAPRSFDEHAPHFQSTPTRFAKVGQLYEVTLDAVDIENKPMFFSKLAGPASLTVNATNGVVDYTPAAAEVGNQFLSFQVTNNIGRDVLSYTLFVLPATNHIPVVNVNGPYAALISQDIQFSSAGTSDSDGDRLRYFWNFGDGATSTNANPVHAYGGIGNYLVSLFVNDGFGGTASAQTHAAITRPNRPPIAVISNAPNFSVRLGETLALNGAGSYDLDGDPITFTWVWGDNAGNTNAASTASHFYTAPGNYGGQLIVADNRGGIGTAGFNVAVGGSNQPPVVVMTLSTNQPFAMTTVTCDATASSDPDGDPLAFAWDFGDATHTTGPLVTHQYHNLGTYTVTLTVSDNHGGVSVATQSVHVLNAPPVFTSSPPLMVRAGTNYTYTPTLSDVDGDTSTFQLVQGPATMSCDTNTGTLNWLPGTNNVGPNPVVLRATDANGASTDQSFTVVVTTPLGAQIDLLPTHIEMTNVIVDSQTLAISGAVTVYLTNAGPDAVPVPFTVSVFVDADADGTYSTNADRLIAFGNFPANLPGGGSGWITFTNISGKALFKDSPLSAFVDSQNVVPEYDEANNIKRSGFDANTNQVPAVDLSASLLLVGRTDLPQSATLTARMGSSGYVAAPANTPMSFYDGDPKAGGSLIGVAHSTAALVPGTYQDLSVTWSNPVIATHTVFVVADDPGTGTNLYPELTLQNNTFSDTVDLATVLPPVADAGSGGSVNIGTTVALNGRNSTDPQGKQLTYRWSLVSIPVASRTQLDAADTVSPSFLADAAGPYTIQLVVNNGVLDSTNSATVVINAVDPNLDSPPTITSTPIFQGMAGVKYTYQVTATDPLGKPLTFRLSQSPVGMTINTNTGLVQWTPTNTANLFVQVAADGPGGSAYQTYSLTVISFTNLPPQFTSTPIQTATPSVAYTYTAVAVSPVGNAITYSLSQKPAGMSIDSNSGVISWTPLTNQMGGNFVTVVANDGHGGTATQSYNVVVLTAGANGPVVAPIPDQTVADPGQFAQIPLDSYVVDPNYPASQITWTVTGNNQLQVNIDANRVATITYASGVRASERVTFLATDPAGKSGFSSPLLTVRGVDNPPIAAIANLSDTDTTSITNGYFGLQGTADDPDAIDPVAYRVVLFDSSGLQTADVTPKPVDASGYHQGRVTGTGNLGNLDFTLVANGAYTLMLIVQGGTQTATATAPIALNCDLKIGQVKFSQQDMILPVAGLPLQVVRTYDSLNPATADFGYSWTYSVADINMTFNEDRSDTVDGFGDTFSMRTGGSRDITITMPDTGRRITFTSSFVNAGLFKLAIIWTPPPGVTATLVPTTSPVLISLFNELTYWQAAPLETTVDMYDFPGFILTTADGTQYHINRENLGTHFLDATASLGSYDEAWGKPYIASVTKPTGEQMQFVRNGSALQGIDDYLGTNKIRSLLFQRDSQNRVAAIFGPDKLNAQGNPYGPADLKYSYDGAGNLVQVQRLQSVSQVTNGTYSATTYEYANAKFPHFITGIHDDRGVTPMRMEYDSDGRLVATIDALGHRTVVQHDLGGKTDTIFDRMGNPTILAYDNQGHVISSTDPLGRTTQFGWDSNGHETSVTDPLGNTSRKEFDSSGNMTALVDALGNRTTYTYDASGHVLTVTDPLGHVSSNGFGPTGNILSAQNALGYTSKFLYDDQNRLTGLVDPLGRTNTQVQYDSAGNIGQVAMDNGRPMTFNYDANGNQTAQQFQWVNPNNSNDVRTLSSQVAYDSANHPTTNVNSIGLVSVTTYNEFGKVASRQDANGGVTSAYYDVLGNTIEVDYPDGAFSRNVYDANSRVIVSTDRHLPGRPANGKHTIYDLAGQVVGVEWLSNVVVSATFTTNNGSIIASSSFVSSAGVLATNGLTYDAASRLIASTDYHGQTTRFEYDAAGHETASIDPAGNRTTFGYDAAGRQTFVRDALNREVDYLYDALGRRVQTVFPDGTSMRTTYDANGNKSTEVNQAGLARNYQYDGAGRLTGVALPQTADPENNNSLTQPQFQYGYNAYGDQQDITDSKGRRTHYEFDPFHRPLTLTLPLGQTSTNEYDASGRLARQTDFNGQVTAYQFDGQGRITSKLIYPAGSSTPAKHVSLTYDAQGRLATITDEGGTTRYSYDFQNRLSALETPQGTIRYEADLFGHETRALTANSDVRYGYDSYGRLTTVTAVRRNGQLLAAPETTTYTYDAIGRRASVTLPNGVTTAYQYDKLDRLTLLTHSNAASGVFTSYAYQRNALGYKTGVVEIKAEAGGVRHTNIFAWSYDELNRLVGETNRYGAMGYTNRYVYDLVGNRLERTVVTGGKLLTTRYSYDANDRLIMESNFVVNAPVAALGTAGTVVPVSGPDGSRPVSYRPQPAAWTYYAWKSIPYALAGAFLLPLALVPLWRRRRAEFFTLDLCPERALLPRCVSGLLIAAMVICSFDLRVLADEAGVYAALSTATWGLDGVVTTYEYDANGSVLRKVTTGAKPEVVDYSYTVENRLSTVSDTVTNGVQVDVTTTQYGYDQNGNRVRAAIQNSVNGVSTGGQTNSFLVDPFNPTGAAQILEESGAAGGVPTMSYTLGAEVISQTALANGQLATEYLLCDGHGSNRQMMDEAGNLTAEYTYDAYGMMLGGNPTAAQPARSRLLYTGEQFDTSLQQYHLRARDYNPGNGRFSSSDPFPGSPDDPQTLHRYAYTHGDPVNNLDPSGEQELAEVMCAVAVASIIVSYGVAPLLSVLTGGRFLPDAAILGVNVLLPPYIGGGSVLAFLGVVLATLTILPLPVVGGIQAAGLDVTGYIRRAVGYLDKRSGIGISLSFESLGDVRDKSISAWLAIGPSVTAGTTASFSITGYVGAVWNTPQYEDYAGPFWGLGATTGEGAGFTQNLFAGSGFTQWGVSTGVTVPVGVPLSFSGSWTVYYLITAQRPASNDFIESNTIRYLLLSPTTTIWANWLVRELYETPAQVDPNHPKVYPLTEDPFKAVFGE